MDKKFHLTRYNECNCLSMLGLKLIHVSKRSPLVTAVQTVPEYVWRSLSE